MDSTSIVLITLSSLSLLTSGATLAIVLVGAKKMRTQVEEVKNKTNKSVQAFISALEEI